MASSIAMCLASEEPVNSRTSLKALSGPFSSFQQRMGISVFDLIPSSFTEGIRKASFCFPIKSIQGLSSGYGLNPKSQFICVPGPRATRSTLLSLIRSRTEFILCCISFFLFMHPSFRIHPWQLLEL